MALLLGLCRIQVKDLAFDMRFLRRARKNQHRTQALQDMRAVLDLAGDSEAPKHSVPVMVFTDTLDSILAHSNCTLSDLAQERDPMLSPPHKLLCLQGWKRINAAMAKDPYMWWRVRLYCIPPGTDPYRVLRREIEDGSHETPWSHGEVMLKALRDDASEPYVKELALKLRSKATRKALRILLEQPHTFPVYSLRDFPGLWAGLELGNIEKHLSLRSTQEIRNYIQCIILTKWRRYTFGDPQVREAVDEVTVEEVAQRTPTCPADRAHIRKLMASGVLLANVQDPERRQRFERELLKEKMFIPSIKALHENLKYLSIAIWIIKHHLLSGLGDKCKGEKAMDVKSDPCYLYRFLRSVQEVGYNSPKIEAALAQILTPQERTIHEGCAEVQDVPIGRRWGRPKLYDVLEGFEVREGVVQTVLRGSSPAYN
ncbi:hypothetical protein GE09DRAFT_1257064 [Coniochaeta sp. 2T2.1]|nr:hypothetical protein GE09DRAFT_1257064 [Coniochaeta sp. 2T2.1]